jgi:hypothetical protein
MKKMEKKNALSPSKTVAKSEKELLTTQRDFWERR